MNRIREHWPLGAALALLAVLFITMFQLCVRHTNGVFIYVLDDAYIHMAHAKNLVSHGIWGVTSFAFSSTASSILWVVMLGLVYVVIGPNEATPLLLNAALCILVTIYLYVLLRRSRFSALATYVTLMMIVAFSCLLQLGFTGLEHVAQMVVSLAFLDVAATVLEEPPGVKIPRPRMFRLFALAPLLTGIRYEGLFLAAVVGLLMLLRRRVRLAVGVLALGVAPILVVGGLAVRHGWHFLPNSILLKSNRPGPSWLGTVEFVLTESYRHLLDLAPLCFLVVACLAVYAIRSRDRSPWERSQLMLAIAVLTTFVHVQFSALSWFMRYEGYLVVLCLVSLAIACVDLIRDLGGRRAVSKALRGNAPRMLAGLLLVLFPVFPLANRAMQSWISLPQSSQNIYEQQYRMGLFCREYYSGRVVAANDIGAISFLSEARVVDIWGLASLEVCDARLQKSRRHSGAWPDLRFLDGLLRAHDVEVIMAYDKVLRRYGEVESAGWVPAGSWTIAHNVVCAEDRVRFYAPDSSQALYLERNLARFSANRELQGRDLDHAGRASTTDPARP